MLMLFISAFGLGLIFNAAPGPVLTETVRQSLRGGYRSALAVQLGSLAGDASWAILGLAGAGALAQIDALVWPLGVVGVAYLTWLSWDSWRAARLHQRISLEDSGDASNSNPLKRGMLLSMTNSQNLAFWAALGSAISALGVQHPTPADYAIVFAGFMAASLAWCFICAWLTSKLLGNLDARWTAMTYRLCAIALLAIALMALRDLLERASLRLHASQARPTVVGRP